MTPRIHDIDDAERWAGEILPSVSRTFALSIRFLPGTLGRAVTTAYLLCRIADTIEDDIGLDNDQKSYFHRMFVAIVSGEIGRAHV